MRHKPVQITLRTENVGSVKDKIVLLMGAMMKMLEGGGQLDDVTHANFDDEPKIVLIVRDPVLSNLPTGTVRADVQPMVV